MSVPVSAQATSQVTETATLTDSAGNPLANQTVTFSRSPAGANTFTVDGHTNTDATGKAIQLVTVNAPATYDFKADFAGDPNYKAATASQTAFVVKAAATITFVLTA